MNQHLYQRNLETSIQTFEHSTKYDHFGAIGTNKWFEERLMQEPINKNIFSSMHNNKYLQVQIYAITILDRYRSYQRTVCS